MVVMSREGVANNVGGESCLGCGPAEFQIKLVESLATMHIVIGSGFRVQN